MKRTLGKKNCVQDGTLENEYNALMTAALAWSHRHREDGEKTC